MKNLLIITGLIIGILVAIPGQAERPVGSSVTLSFGVVPQQSANELAHLWIPIMRYLGEKTGYVLRFKTAKDIPTFEQRVSAGDYDIVYMNPYHYTVFHQSPGYEVLVREKDRKIKGIIVVRKDSTYRDIAELKNRTIAFPAPAAFAASVLPRAYMNHLGISHKPAYVSSHDSVYRAVAKSIYPAGGGIVSTFNKLDPKIHEQLRILWETPGFTSHPIAVHPRVDKKTVQILRDAMIKMDQDPKGAKFLKAMGFNGLLAAHDADYDDIRALHITLLQNLLKK